jgi:hypothetical protein
MLLIGASLVALSGPIANALDRPGSDPAGVRTHVVERGETLWSIAVGLQPGRDPRDIVFEITETNGVDPGSLVPGQELVVPVG